MSSPTDLRTKYQLTLAHCENLKAELRQERRDRESVANNFHAMGARLQASEKKFKDQAKKLADLYIRLQSEKQVSISFSYLLCQRRIFFFVSAARGGRTGAFKHQTICSH